jgi:multiple sugar transport system permease protein
MTLEDASMAAASSRGVVGAVLSRRSLARAYQLRRRLHTIPGYALVALVALVWLFPIYWIVTLSVKSDAELAAVPPVLVPQHATLDNYSKLLFVLDFGRFLQNSILVAAGATLIGLTAGTLCAYSLSRYHFPWRLNYWILFILLGIRIFPPTVTLIPLFVFFRNIGLLDTLLAVILAQVYFDLPFIVLLMRGFFADIPIDLEEAARVDGDTKFGAFRHVVAPLVAPGLIATAILVVIGSWNEFTFALVLTESRAVTLPVATAGLVQQYGIAWGPMTASGVLFTIPVLIFAVLVQRNLIRGLTAGAIKA